MWIDNTTVLSEANLTKFFKAMLSQSFVVEGFTQSYTGLTLTVAAGKAIIAGYWVEYDTSNNFTLVDNSTNYLFLGKDGLFHLDQDNTPPSDSIKICTATTSGGAVTTLTDKRPLELVTASEVLLSGEGTSATKLDDVLHPSNKGKLDGADIYQPSIPTAALNANAIHQALQAGSTALASTTATDWVDMPDMSVTLTTLNSPVLAIASMNLSHSAGTSGLVRVFLAIDDVGKIEHYVRFPVATIYGDTAPATLSWLETLSAGQHIIKVRWLQNGGTGYVRHRYLQVIELKR
jgi:hypothetical protein